MIEAYPADQGYEIFYLARDGQLPYYAARFLAKAFGIPSNHHLINVSKQTIKDPLLGRYLRQEGLISALAQGKRVVVFDIAINTGRNIRGLFDAIPSAFHPQIEIKTIVSGIPGAQQGRLFLASLDPAMASRGALDLHMEVDRMIEHGTPKRTHSAQSYQVIDRRVVPRAPVDIDYGQDSRRKDPTGEGLLLQDLKSEILNHREEYKRRVESWRALFKSDDAVLLGRIGQLVRSRCLKQRALGSDLLEMFAMAPNHRPSLSLGSAWVRPRNENGSMLAEPRALDAALHLTVARSARSQMGSSGVRVGVEVVRRSGRRS
jgi:hypothetical protein